VFISQNKQQSAHTRVILKPTLATVDPSIGTKMYMFDLLLFAVSDEINFPLFKDI